MSEPADATVEPSVGKLLLQGVGLALLAVVLHWIGTSIGTAIRDAEALELIGPFGVATIWFVAGAALSRLPLLPLMLGAGMVQAGIVRALQVPRSGPDIDDFANTYVEWPWNLVVPGWMLLFTLLPLALGYVGGVYVRRKRQLRATGSPLHAEPSATSARMHDE